MTSHELARLLLIKPDVVVIGKQTGQGSNEGGNDDLVAIQFATADAYQPDRIELIF